MSAAAQAATSVVVREHDVSPTPARVRAALARIEGVRIVRHPAFLLGLAGSAYTLWSERSGDVQQYWMLIGQAMTALAAMTFLVGFLNAARVHRDDAGELFGALPAGPAERTAGMLLSLWAPAAVAAAVAAIAWLLEVGPDGRIAIDLEPLSPSLLEPAQAPLIVASFGALGMCFGRWTPQTALAPLLTLAIGVGPLAWSIPWVVLGTVPYLPSDNTWLVGSPGWHLVFLAGVIVTAGGLALLRDSRRPAIAAVTAAGAAALVLGLALHT